jgi:hypothetical protein
MVEGVDTSAEPPPTSPSKSLEAVIHRKSAQVARLRTLLDSLQENVISRENEVIELELMAAQHQKRIEEASAKRKELEDRRAAAVERRKRLQAQMVQRDVDRRPLLANLTTLRAGIMAAEAEKVRLDKVEEPIIVQEELLRELEERIREAERVIIEATERQKALGMERIDRRQRMVEMVDELKKDFAGRITRYRAAQADVNERTEYLEQIMAARRKMCQYEKDRFARRWAEKNESIGAFISLLQGMLVGQPTNEQLDAKWQDLREEEQALKDAIVREEEMLKAVLRENRLPGLQREEEEARKERDALTKVMAEIEEEQDKVFCQEAELNAQADDLQLKNDTWAERTKALEIRERAAENLVSRYTADLKEAERMCEQLGAV